MAATTLRFCDDEPLGGGRAPGRGPAASAAHHPAPRDPGPRGPGPRDQDPRDQDLRRVMPLIRTGDTDAFEVFYDLTSPLAYGLACHLLGAGPAAERALENAYRTAWATARHRAPRPEDAVHWILGLVQDQADAPPARTA